MPRTSGSRPRNERVALAVVDSGDARGAGTVARARTVLLSGTVRVEYDVSVPDGSDGKRDLHVRVEFPDEVRSMLESTTWGRGSSIFEAISGALKSGDEVRLVGFGTFSVAKRKASTGRNPRTGEPMKIKASSQPKFKAGKGLKDAVN